MGDLPQPGAIKRRHSKAFSDATRAAESLLQFLLRLRKFDSPWARRGVLIAASAAFLAGAIISYEARPGLLADIHILPVMAVLLFCAPMTIVLNALEFRCSAQMINYSVSLPTALTTTIIGTAANMLPLPGSTMVRVGALKVAGAGYRLGNRGHVHRRTDMARPLLHLFRLLDIEPKSGLGGRIIFGDRTVRTCDSDNLGSIDPPERTNHETHCPNPRPSHPCGRNGRLSVPTCIRDRTHLCTSLGT